MTNGSYLKQVCIIRNYTVITCRSLGCCLHFLCCVYHVLNTHQYNTPCCVVMAITHSSVCLLGDQSTNNINCRYQPRIGSVCVCYGAMLKLIVPYSAG